MKKKQKINEKQNIPQVKVCGLTNQDEAAGCVSLGADAIGCVFFSKSPRNVSLSQAKKIVRALPSHVKAVGVFVNETFSSIMQRVERCHFNAVQLHGQEPPELVSRLLEENLHVIKALFIDGKPSLQDVSSYQASAFLVECGLGRLPGGNALEWNWEQAKSFGEKHPLIIAGGLTPENVCYAVEASAPHAVDVSSGVESVPGRKDPGKVGAFMSAVSGCRVKKNLRKIF